MANANPHFCNYDLCCERVAEAGQACKRHALYAAVTRGAQGRKYRGKYPTRVAQHWGTRMPGVYGCKTNAGALYFYAARDARAAGYANHGVPLGADVGTLPFLVPTTTDAALRQGYTMAQIKDAKF